MAGVVGYTMSLGAKNIKKCMLSYKPAVLISKMMMWVLARDFRGFLLRQTIIFISITPQEHSGAMFLSV